VDWTPIIPPISALFGAWLGAWLQRKATQDAQRSLRLERTVEERTQPIADYLHHATVVLSSQTHVHKAGAVQELPEPIKTAYEESVSCMYKAHGPAAVRASMLGNDEFSDKFAEAHALMIGLALAAQQDATEEDLATLWDACKVAIGNAMGCLEDVQERLAQSK
jgi:hypothetical protein